MTGSISLQSIFKDRQKGAEVRIIGRSQDEAQIDVDRLVAEEGMVMLPPFDRTDIIAGRTATRSADTEITLCDLTGTGVQDTAIATLARQRAEAAGAGTVFNS